MIPPLTGVVLAGGRSTRMGQDKALLEMSGRRLVDIVVDVLAAVCDGVVVASGPRPIPDLDVRQVHDTGEEGPLAGIVAGLATSTTQLAAVVAVDMPFADGQLLLDLAQRWTGQVCVVPRAGGFVQPLHAVYAVAGQPKLRELLAAGQRSAAQAVEDLGALIVDVEDATFARNLNVPQDLTPAEPSG